MTFLTADSRLSDKFGRNIYMTTIILNSPDDVTPEVKKDLLHNNLDKLIINFNVVPCFEVTNLRF